MIIIIIRKRSLVNKYCEKDKKKVMETVKMVSELPARSGHKKKRKKSNFDIT